jgi:choline dehydrogenase-like flavoprotein
MGDFDYLILGGGTAGCILANRLTESGRHRVLLVEADGRATQPVHPRPGRVRTPAPQPTLQLGLRVRTRSRHRRSPDPRAERARFGGSGLINGMVYVRGQADYDGWAAAGATGWAHADVEPYFRRFENYAQGGHGRGSDGPLHITQVRERFPVADAFLRAAVRPRA